MNKDTFFAKPRRICLSLTALILLIGITVSCEASIPPDNSSSAASSTQSILSSSYVDTASPPDLQTTDAELTTEPITTEPITTEPVTTAPETSATPEIDTSLQMLQSVMTSASRDADYITLYDLTDNRLLYSTGEDQMIYPASTTKLLTLLYALTVVDADDIFKVGREIEIAPADSSKAWISVDQKFTVRDLAAALLLPSGNDAAYTIAVSCGRIIADNDSLSAEGALAVFMNGLNAYAADLGLSSTHFVTPDGYHDPDHYTTMRDMLEIARLARENSLIAELIATPSYTAEPLNFGKNMTWQNTNLLLSEDSRYYYASATGMKTGYHSDAGVCLIASAEEDGRTLLLLLFHGEDKSARFADAKDIFESAFAILG